MLTEKSIHQFTAHVASQNHAMAGATIAASAALACALGQACIGINASHTEGPGERTPVERVAEQLSDIRACLQALADEDGEAITALAALRASGRQLEGQDRLCQMPSEMAQLATRAASFLQDFRPLAQFAQDDLEMAITLLVAAAHAAALLLDSNLRIWPDPMLLARYEPELKALRDRATGLHAVERIRP